MADTAKNTPASTAKTSPEAWTDSGDGTQYPESKNGPNPSSPVAEVAKAIPDPMDSGKSDAAEELEDFIEGAEAALFDQEAKLPRAAEDLVKLAIFQGNEALASKDNGKIEAANLAMKDAMRNAAAAYNALIDPAVTPPVTEPYGMSESQERLNPHTPTADDLIKANQLGHLSEPINDEPKTVMMLFPTPVNLRVSPTKLLRFKAGLNAVPEEYADHDYLVRNKVRPVTSKQSNVKPTQPGHAPKMAQ